MPVSVRPLIGKNVSLVTPKVLAEERVAGKVVKNVSEAVTAPVRELTQDEKVYNSIVEKTNQLNKNAEPSSTVAKQAISMWLKMVAQAGIAVQNIGHAIVDFGRAITRKGQKHYETSVQFVKEILENNRFSGNIGMMHRLKSTESTLAKICKVYKNDQNTLITQRPGDIVGDVIGMRVVFEKPTAKNIMSFLNRIIEKGGKITSLGNYKHPEAPAYITTADIDTLCAKMSGVPMEQGQRLSKSAKKAAKKANPELWKNAGDVQPGITREYIHQDKSDYSSVHIKVDLPDGMPVEIQLRGAETNKIAEAEHIIYDLNQHKAIGDGWKNVEEAYTKVKADATDYTHNSKYAHFVKEIEQSRKSIAAKGMKSKVGEPITLKDIYRQYLKDVYRYARLTESGIKAKMPKLPAGVPSLLDYRNLYKTKQKLG